jgi:glycerol uptake facilitator-like aquaporin
MHQSAHRLSAELSEQCAQVPRGDLASADTVDVSCENLIIHVHPRGRRIFAEFVGSLLLTAVVVGSGIAAQRLSPGNAGIELAENATTTMLGLVFLIAVFAPISGAHLNPILSLVDAALGRRTWLDAASYIPAQIAGCIAGVVLANLMFGEAAVVVSTTDRLTPGHFLSEILVTAGLVLVVFVLARTGRSRLAPVVVAVYIGAGCFFTSSACFANPAITVARMFTDSLTGIAPSSTLGYIAAQLVGAAVGYCAVTVLTPGKQRPSS